MKKVKAAIVGCGVISDVYLQSFKDNFSIMEVVACSDLDEDRMQQTAQKYGLKAMSYDDVLENPFIEMVINLTSPKAHYILSKKALMAGKHVYSEKMMAIEFEEGKELCRLADEKQVRFGSAPDTFLGGGVQTAKYAVDKGLVGTINSGVISLTRDYRVFGENLPHLFKKGGSVLYDMGGYYLTAVCSILGSVKKVFSFGKKTEEVHTVNRVGSPLFGEEISLDESNVITAVLEFANGALITLHLNSSTVIDETFHLELYGDKGILCLGDPNTFGGAVTLQKAGNAPVELPFTHGFQAESRGLGAAEMAWSIAQDRPHRVSKEMALHVLEIVHGIFSSIDTGKYYEMETEFQRPESLPEGMIGKGFWEPNEESALIL